MKPEELESIALKNPLVYGISYIDLLEGRKWEIGARKWSTEIYQAVNPYYIEKNPIGQARRLVITKSTQCGMSTMGVVRLFHLADFWPVRLMYTLPRQQDVLDFVGTRVDPMIRASKRLEKKLGNPDSTRVKNLGGSYIFFAEASVEPRMMPVDALFIDEVDLSDPDHVSTALNRLDASNWKLNYFFSTPTLPNYGIHGMYESSDKRRWLVKCPGCNHEQPLEWDINLRIKGPANKPDKVYYGCAKCDSEITLEQIQEGRWVAEKPDITDTVGYHISQMMTYTAAQLYAHWRDPQTKLLEFHRKRLGMPFEIGEGSLERDDFLVNCFDEPYDFEGYSDGSSRYFMGVDQGNELQVLIGKIDPESRRPKIVHVELIPFEEGFDRVAELIRAFKVRRCVIDANPNRHSAVKLQEAFPGRVVLADYIEQKTLFTTKKEGKKNYISNVTINRTQGFDELFSEIRDGRYMLPGQPPKLHPLVELLIDHVTALKRDVETRRSLSGEVQVGVYRKIRAEHLAHSWLYMHIAMEIDKGAKFRVRKIGKIAEEEDPEETKPGQPNNKEMTEITARLAEVPTDQLLDYVGSHNQVNYKPPFPLSYKLTTVEESDHTEENILWVIKNVLLKDRLGRHKNK
jgi:hypothetical protein